MGADEDEAGGGDGGGDDIVEADVLPLLLLLLLVPVWLRGRVCFDEGRGRNEQKTPRASLAMREFFFACPLPLLCTPGII